MACQVPALGFQDKFLLSAFWKAQRCGSLWLWRCAVLLPTAMRRLNSINKLSLLPAVAVACLALAAVLHPRVAPSLLTCRNECLAGEELEAIILDMDRVLQYDVLLQVCVFPFNHLHACRPRSCMSQNLLLGKQ